jgi:predicted DNA-binding transcriptional regulator AlpA
MRRAEQWLTPLQFAQAVGLARSTVYNRIAQGDIDDRLIEYAGPRKILLHPRAVRYFRAVWKRERTS